jgi:hypothetical protein
MTHRGGARERRFAAALAGEGVTSHAAFLYSAARGRAL